MTDTAVDRTTAACRFCSGEQVLFRESSAKAFCGLEACGHEYTIRFSYHRSHGVKMMRFGNVVAPPLHCNGGGDESFYTPPPPNNQDVFV